MDINPTLDNFTITLDEKTKHAISFIVWAYI